MEITDETIDLLLGALADQLQMLGALLEIVVIGGSALTAGTSPASSPGRTGSRSGGLRAGRELAERRTNGSAHMGVA
jgi:hypothetical protein